MVRHPFVLSFVFRTESARSWLDGSRGGLHCILDRGITEVMGMRCGHDFTKRRYLSGGKLCHLVNRRCTVCIEIIASKCDCHSISSVA